jgi:hypothetical protein
MIGMLVAYNDKDLLSLQGRFSSLSYIQNDIYIPIVKVTILLPNRPSLSLSTVLESKVVPQVSYWPATFEQ